MVLPSMRLLSMLTGAVLLAGCTAAGTQSSPPSSSTTPTVAASETVSAPAPSQPASAEPLPVLAARSIQVRGIPATLSLNEVVVSGNVTVVTWSLRNDFEGSSSFSRRIQMTAQFFGDGQFADGVPNDAYYVDGAYLIDTVNKLRYLPARDTEGVCVCSLATSNIYVEPGTTMSFSATFKAIPDAVGTIDVSIPRTAVFRNVAVQR